MNVNSNEHPNRLTYYYKVEQRESVLRLKKDENVMYLAGCVDMEQPTLDYGEGRLEIMVTKEGKRGEHGGYEWIEVSEQNMTQLACRIIEERGKGREEDGMNDIIALDKKVSDIVCLVSLLYENESTSYFAILNSRRRVLNNPKEIKRMLNEDVWGIISDIAAFFSHIQH